MNWVPFVFIDAVCHQLKHEAFQELSKLSAGWSRFGAGHRKKRREFTFSCRVNGKESSYSIKNRTELVVADFNLEFDRITWVNCDSTDQLRNRISLEELKSDVFPIVASLAANCYWPSMTHLTAQNRFFFNAFKNCPGFSEISVEEQGQESRDFVARQVELGNVQELYLYARQQSINWPEPEILAKTLKTFVNSGRFHRLTYDRSLPTDIELFELFLERAIAGELKPGAFISLSNIALEKSQRIRSLHQECKEHPKKLAWRIPNSRCRVTFDQCAGTMEIV